jgi:hypothetical protein
MVREAAIIFLGSVMLAVPVAAQQSLPRTSGDPLKEICTSFLEQSGQGVSGDRNSLCTCLVRETQARLTRDEMKIYNEAGQTGRQVPDAIMQKVLGIATNCLTGAR